MQASDLISILPLIILGGTAVLVMLATTIRRNHLVAAMLGGVGLLAAMASLPAVAPSAGVAVTPLLHVDAYGFFFTGLLCAAAFVVVVLGYEYLAKGEGERAEFYMLLLLATLGASVLTMSAHFASFFLGLELLSVSLYGLIAFLPQRRRGYEAALKYLILAAAASAFLLFGMALIYTEVGALDFEGLGAALLGGDPNLQLVVPGVALMVVGIGFKLAVAPFHMWTPDVYEGAPAPVSAFIATVSKGAVVALALRVFLEAGLYAEPAVYWSFAAIAVASMFLGNLLALLQDNIKRLLAYSSIAHLGYVLVALVVGGEMSAEAVSFYVVAYMLTTLGAFGAVAVMSYSGDEAELIDCYYGLFWRRPLVAAAFTAMLLSLAGIPLTAGFLGKWLVLAAGASQAEWALVLLLIVNSAIGLFYYLRVIVMMIRDPSEQTSTAGLGPDVPGAPLSSFALAALTVGLVAIGVYPAPLLALIETAAASLGY